MPESSGTMRALIRKASESCHGFLALVSPYSAGCGIDVRLVIPCERPKLTRAVRTVYFRMGRYELMLSRVPLACARLLS